MQNIQIVDDSLCVLFCQSDESIGDVKVDYPKDLYFTKQTIGNACGTVAVVHSLANNATMINFDGRFTNQCS